MKTDQYLFAAIVILHPVLYRRLTGHWLLPLDLLDFPRIHLHGAFLDKVPILCSSSESSWYSPCQNVSYPFLDLAASHFGFQL